MKAALRTAVFADVAAVGADARLRRLLPRVDRHGAGCTTEDRPTADGRVTIDAGTSTEVRAAVDLTSADLAWALEGAQVGVTLAAEDPGAAPAGGRPRVLVVDLAEVSGRQLASGPRSPVAALDAALADPRTAGALTEVPRANAPLTVEATVAETTWTITATVPDGTTQRSVVVTVGPAGAALPEPGTASSRPR